MNKSDHNIKLLQEALSRYHLTRPVSDDEQKRVYASKKHNYKRILKTLGLYSLLNALLVPVYFYVKKTGVKLFIIRLVLGLVGTAAVGGGIYYLVSSGDKPGTQTDPLHSSVHKLKNQTITAQPASKPKPVRFTITIPPVSTSSVDHTTAAATRHALLKAFSLLKGQHYATASGSAPFKLAASIEEIEGSYLLYLKVIDRKNTAIVYVAREKTHSRKTIAVTCRKMVQSIIKKIK